MKHIWSVLCSKAVVDKETNSISLFNCVEQIVVQLFDVKKRQNNKKGLVPVEFEFVHLFFDENISKEREFEVATELYDPNNKKINEFAGKFTLPKRMRRFRAHIKLNALHITLQGKYEFRIKFKEKGQKSYKEATNIPLDISIK